MLEERKNVHTTKGNPVTLLGPEIKPGDKAPGFTLLDENFNEVNSQSFGGNICIYNVVSSLDTSVCDTQTRRFNEEAAKLKNVEIITISVDLPSAQKRWCGAAGIKNVRVLSDYRDLSFGKAFGVLIKELHLLARSVFVVNRDGVVSHVEYVKEMTTYPNYEKALNVAISL